MHYNIQGYIHMRIVDKNITIDELKDMSKNMFGDLVKAVVDIEKIAKFARANESKITSSDAHFFLAAGGGVIGEKK